MEDRVSKYPGRVKLTPVDGQPGLFDMTRADEPLTPGTPLAKGTLLSDLVCERLEISKTATPNDALNRLSGLPNLYIWKRVEIIRKEGYSVGPVLQSEIAFMTPPGDEIPVTFNIKLPPLQVAEDGYPKFSGGTVLRSNTVKKGDIANKFVRLSPTEEHPEYSGLNPNDVYFFPSDVTIRKDFYGSHWDAYASKYQKVTTFPRITKSTLVWSFDPHKYDGMDTETVTYEPLGLWGDKATVIEGKYTGTGEYGRAHPNSITFPVKPKFLYLPYDIGTVEQSLLWIESITEYGTVRPGNPVHLSGNTITWYSDDAREQFNAAGVIYHYFAIL